MDITEGLNKQVLALGFPSVRIMLHAISKHFDKLHVSSRIEEICHVQEVGCISVEFFNKNLEQKETIVIVLKECKKNHNLTEQLNKLKVHLDEDKWNNILKNISSMVFIARSLYASIYEHNLDLIEEIVGSDNINKYSKLSIDIDNTTLFLPDIDDRIGIFLEYTS